MNDLGTLISVHNTKKIYKIIYLFPVVILLCALFPVGNYILSTPADSRTMLYVLVAIILLLALILLISMQRKQPNYHFELWDNGLRLIFKNKKKTPEHILFSDIHHYWQYRMPQNRQAANLLVLQYKNNEYAYIDRKYSNAESLIKTVLNKTEVAQLPLQKEILTKGGRIEFLLLPSTTHETILTENALLPYIQNATIEKMSLDKYALFNGEKVESIPSIHQAKLNPDNNSLVILSHSGAILFEYNYDLISNYNLFLQLVNFLAIPA